MTAREKLNDKLLRQSFTEADPYQATLERFKQAAYSYSQLENSIAVLSDLRENRSYIYPGRISSGLGIFEGNHTSEIDTIWEDEIFVRIHPDDVEEKHLLELKFLHFINKQPAIERQNYHILSKMRIKDSSEKYAHIQHRMFYIYDSSNTSPRLALCLYSYPYEKQNIASYDGKIINSLKGSIVIAGTPDFDDILSGREKEILTLIRGGKKSREIAEMLFISKHTVDKHRQHIFQKLQVGNSMEACRIAERMNLI